MEEDKDGGCGMNADELKEYYETIEQLKNVLMNALGKLSDVPEEFKDKIKTCDDLDTLIGYGNGIMKAIEEIV